MKNLKLIVFTCLAAVIIFLQWQCGEMKQARQNPDDSGNPDAWGASINENANEML